MEGFPLANNATPIYCTKCGRRMKHRGVGYFYDPLSGDKTENVRRIGCPIPAFVGALFGHSYWLSTNRGESWACDEIGESF